MSAAMIKAHGGSKNILTKAGAIQLGGLIQNTQSGVPKDVKEKHLDRLISNTTGIPQGRPVMEGVLTKTATGGTNVPEFHKVKETKSVSKMGVGGTYAGGKSGYGKAKK